MIDTATELKLMRPPGPVAATCRSCPIFDRCGGIQNSRPLLNCFDQFCCGDGSCDNICLHHPEFVARLQEVGGLGVDNLPRLRQEPIRLPNYVPMIHHANRRSKVISSEYVALDPYKLFRLKQREYSAVAHTPESLRRYFRVASNANVILRGTAIDADLERYWSYRNVSNVCEKIASLDVSLFVGPNFSTFLDVPRTDALFNRKRQLLCLSELSEAGVSVAPHLSATMPSDWRFWCDYLQDNFAVTHVALNCQTGYKRASEGRKAIRQIESMQQQIGRGLSLLLVGGGQFLKSASHRFSNVTLIDSEPFMRTMKRRRMTSSNGKRRWEETFTLENQPLDCLLSENVESYSDWAERQTVENEISLR